MRVTGKVGLYTFGSHLVVELARIGDSNKASETPLRYTNLYATIISQHQNPERVETCSFATPAIVGRGYICGTALRLWDGHINVGRTFGFDGHLDIKTSSNEYPGLVPRRLSHQSPLHPCKFPRMDFSTCPPSEARRPTRRLTVGARRRPIGGKSRKDLKIDAHCSRSLRL